MSATPPASTPPSVPWEGPERTDGPAPGIEFAPHGARLVAYLLDGVIIAIVCGILALIAVLLLASATTVEGDEVTSVGVVGVLGFAILFLLAGLIGLLYFPWFWARGGQTPGMRPFDLRVVSDRDGSAIGWGTALLRLVGLWVAGAVFYLGYIWIFIDKRRRGWQDLIAGTIVVKQP